MQWKNITDFPQHAWSNADKVMFNIFIHILIEKNILVLDKIINLSQIHIHTGLLDGFPGMKITWGSDNALLFRPLTGRTCCSLEHCNFWTGLWVLKKKKSLSLWRDFNFNCIKFHYKENLQQKGHLSPVNSTEEQAVWYKTKVFRKSVKRSTSCHNACSCDKK